MTFVRFSARRHVALSAVMLAVGMMATSALAVPTINLTTSAVNGVAPSDSGVINGGTFAWNNPQPTGTGVFNPFLRLQLTGKQSGDEQGYNTSGQEVNVHDVLDNKSPVNWTHDLLISSLQKTTDGLYYQFTLDINESNGQNRNLLSLDGLRLFSTNTPGQSADKTTPLSIGDLNYSTTGSGVAGGALKGNLLYDMDGGTDNSVLLDVNRNGNPPGSGVADMIFLIPKAVIDNRANQGDQYLILWSRFGLSATADAINISGSTADAGFEEWSYRSSVGPTTGSSGSSGSSGAANVPSPGSSALTLLGLAMMGAAFRARKLARKQA